MADPLSITASTIAILGTLKAAKKSIDVLRELRHAPDTVLVLVNELSEFQLCLERLYQLSEAEFYDESFRKSLQKLLKQCTTAVQETLDLIDDKVSLFRRVGNFSEDNAERLGWLFSKGTIRVHQERLQQLRCQLLTILSSTTVSHSIQTRVEIERIETITQRLYERVDALDANVNASKQVIVQGFMATDQNLRSLQEQLGYGLRGSRQTDIVRMTVSTNPGFQDCGPYCDCPCHRDQTVAHTQSPRLLDQVIGSLFLGYSATPTFTPQCVMTCRRRASKKCIRISYFFPAWFYWRAINAAVSFSDLGPELVIRMPRAMPADWKIFGRAYNNEVPALRQLLITKQAAPTDTDAFTGQTSLHQAAFTGAIDSCQILIHAGADPHAEDKSRQTPYQMAWSHILSNDLGDETSQKLRELFTDTGHLDEWTLSTLHRIVLGFIVTALDAQALAWSQSDINVVDSHGRTALFWAAARKDIEKVEFLLKHGADPTIRTFDGETAIHAAAKSGGEHIVRRLIAYGANINTRDKNDKLPLHHALQYERHIEYLLQLGSDLSVRDCHSRPAMWYAAERNSLDNFYALLRRNANLDPQDNAGWSPLHVNVEKNQCNMANLLIANGANTALLTSDGRSVLHFGAEFGSTETLNMLSQAPLIGVDLKTKNADGRTAQQMAARRRAAAEAAGSGLGEDWDQAFERLLEKVVSSNVKANEVEKLEDDGEDSFLDAQESI